jgi:Ca-activated chloride channel family protein
MNTSANIAPLVAATGKPLKLAMQRLWLGGQILPAGARLVVQHVFRSEEEKPLEVIYAFPLPRDAALRSFRITGEGFEAHSELKATDEAVKAYEQGIAKGALSTLARQYGDGVVNLTVGNIRPKETVTIYLEILSGVELQDDGFRFRFPFTLAPAYHTRARFAATAEGEGEMELPADEFGDVILPRIRKDASTLHQVGFELTIVGQLALDEIGSPSHPLRIKQDGGNAARVSPGAGMEVPNRDLVLDARFKSVEPQVLAGRGKDGKGHFAAIVPSAAFGVSAETPRRVVMLLDRSGSMQGNPLSQACKAIEACLGALSETDSFGLVAFDNQTITFQPELVAGNRAWRDKAHEFLEQVEARGGTELANGFLEAAKLLERRGGDILILTDGQVSGTEKILADARSAGVRLHCLGIGSASQDRFLALLARETGGVSRFVTPRERVDLSAVDLFASIGRSVASALTASANIQPEPPSCVFSGTPVLLFGEADGEKENQIELTWNGGRLILPVSFSEGAAGETLWLLRGSRLITDWESRYPASRALAPLEKRKQNRIAGRLLSLSETYGLASREMSLVAVVARTGDRPGELPETRVVPLGMPQDVEFGLMDRCIMAASPPEALMAAPTSSPAIPKSLKRMLIEKMGKMNITPKSPPPAQSDEFLLDLAARVESDGGMPGDNPEARASATVVALLAFLSQGHTPWIGAFRSHVTRLLTFLKSMFGLPSLRQPVVSAVIELAAKGRAPAGDWIALAQIPGIHWAEIEKAVLKP